MSELTLTMLRLGLLILLWVFVLATVNVLRRDLYGTRLVTRTPKAASPRATIPAPSSSGGADRGAPRKLVVIEGSMMGTTLDLSNADTVVGRAPECSLVLNDDYSSGRHLRIFEEQGQWYVEDLDSTNGTFMGREQIRGKHSIGVGTQLRIGRTILELRR